MDIRIRAVCQAAGSKICDYRQYIYFLILTQLKPLYFSVAMLNSIALYIFTKFYYILGNITQGFNRFLILVYVLWDTTRREINVHFI
jgi:hypothetical protein